MTIPAITPSEAQRAAKAGATLIDIRDSDEHARMCIPGALSVPLDKISEMRPAAGPIIFHCRSGMRTDANAEALATAANGEPCYILCGGIEAWRAAGLPVNIDPRQPLEVMRQVQLIAGGLVLAGVMLGFLASPAFFGLSAIVGGGLMLAGATGWCGMARLLLLMPWNRRAQSA